MDNEPTDNDTMVFRIVRLWNKIATETGIGHIRKGLTREEKENLAELIGVGYSIVDIERAFKEYGRLASDPTLWEWKYFPKYYDLSRFLIKGIIKFSNPAEVARIEENRSNKVREEELR